MPRKESRRYSLAHRDRARGARDRGRRRWLCRSTVPISMSSMVAAEQLVDEGAVHLVCPFGGRLMLEFHRVTRCPTWAAEASPCAGTSMPCNPIVPEVPFGGELLSVISPLLPLGEVDDEGCAEARGCRTSRLSRHVVLGGMSWRGRRRGFDQHVVDEKRQLH